MRVRLQHPITRLLRKPCWRVLGINSGTSIDAVDLALLEICGSQRGRAIRPLHTRTYPFPPSLRKTLESIAGAEIVDKQLVSRTHFLLGEWIAQCVGRFSRELTRAKLIDLIGCHGQTIGHFACARGNRRSSTNATWQIGSTAVIARQTGVVTVGDFRAADVAAGGMGAPLSGYYHYLLFGDRHIVLNIGGIANLSAARLRRGRLEIMAFDVGPGNMIIDALARMVLRRPYDHLGRIAARGEADQRVVERVLRHSYFRRPPPKTCGREEFGNKAVRSWFSREPLTPARAPALLATAVTITAQAVSNAIQRWIEPFVSARSLILCGGGTRNRTLVRSLCEHLPAWDVVDAECFGLPPQYVEPAGFALLAYEALHARPGNCGGATGAEPAVLGTISLP